MKVVSNTRGSGINKIQDLKFACILDEFSYKSFSYEGNFINLKCENWKQVLNAQMPDILLVESAWDGEEGSWRGKIVISSHNKRSRILQKLINWYKLRNLRQLVRWCKRNGIPTVFWNKEDPIHYEQFKDSAKLFEYVFTTDSNMVEIYRKKLGIINVYCLPFAVQPKLHNPIKLNCERQNKLCFAGGYYQGHEERKKDMEELLDIAIDFGLDIYDRFLNVDTRNKFPEKYRPYIVGDISYDNISLVYKGYKALINFNTIKDSPTMFSRRVYEVLSSGTPLISNYSRGIEKLIGNGIVLMGKNKDEHIKNINKIMNDEQYWHELSVKGVREVLSRHTYRHRLEYILKTLGYGIEDDEPFVTVISWAQTECDIQKLVESFKSQMFDKKKLNIIVNNENMRKCVENCDISIFTEEEIGKIQIKDYISYFSPNNSYDRYYLMDLILATKYAEAEVIGIDDNMEYSYVSSLKLDSCIIRKDIFKGLSNDEIVNSIKSKTALSSYCGSGIKLFAINRHCITK